MSDLVNPDQIESIVGVKRHETEHYARAVPSDDRVYILHSEHCRATTPDLRDCLFSQALDRGIVHHIPWSAWRRLLNRPVRAEVFRGWLVPDLMSVRALDEEPQP